MTTKSGRMILRLNSLGFAVFVLLTWLSELIHLPHLLFNEPPEFSWARLLFRVVVITAIWGWTHFTTRRLLRRLHELEGFLLVCSWCRRVGQDGGWLTMEQYFGSHLATETSHGICPDCADKQIKNHRAALRVHSETKT